MAVKATLKIVLMANDVEIAESGDAVLWQNVFAAINEGGSQITTLQASSTAATEAQAQSSATASVVTSSGGLGKFAAELGITEAEVQGALAPSNEEPYIHLDNHCWEALKKNTPPRGAQAVAPIALAGTVLALWFKHAEIEGIPSTKQCQAVLNTIHMRDKNSARSLKNTEWLQSRGNGIVINPAQHSRAVSLAAAYCTKSPIQQK